MKTPHFRVSTADSEQKERSRVQDEHMEIKLDEALMETFPASDPIAIDAFSSQIRDKRSAPFPKEIDLKDDLT